ncbi:type IV pilus twitching motility protein PilT [Candidatus Sumerlaeota bacterium]|nr:type IV pilus twitching motility protein PilT [Candidatus Sumerlaeota bacterium]
MSMRELLADARELNASDLHLTINTAPIVRIDGELRALPYPPLKPEDTERLIYSVLNDSQRAEFEEKWELDLSVEIEDVGRFRTNIHKQRGAVEAAFRVVSENIKTLEQLGIPEVVGDFARYENGLVLITGPTGSGKTTTMASLMNLINLERSCMVITIEDPIEYVHKNNRSIIKQREVHADTQSFGAALRHVLRQDPDVIGIGEMRDQETISTALTAAETGHLVIATIHTPDVSQTVDRIIDVFPPYQQPQIRYQLASSLQGIVAQQLIPLRQGEGRAPACEVLVATLAVRKMIRDGSSEQIYTTIQTSFEQGMITMDRSIKSLYERGLVSYEMALAKCKYPDQFERI